MADIVVQDITPRNQYTAGAGSPTAFSYTFPVFALTDVIVYVTPVGTLANDVANILVYNVGYTVTNNAAPAVGGSITLTAGLNVGDIITIVRDQPDNRLNNYLDGGLFEATDVNTDFDRTVMMSQQDKMYDRVLGAHYNNAAIITPTVDNVLPVLPANSLWMKNSANTAIIAVTLPGSGGGGQINVPSVTNKFAYFTNTAGNISSSVFTVPAADGLAGSVMQTNGAGVLSFTTVPLLQWVTVAVNTAMSPSFGYLVNFAGNITMTLPAVCPINSIIKIAGITQSLSGLFTIAQNAGQIVQFNYVATTTGAGGSLVSMVQGSCITLICTTANTNFLVLDSVGNFIVT